MSTPKPLKDRLTATMLQKLQKRKMTNAQAAEILGVSETYLSRVVSSMQQKEPGKVSLERKAATKLYKARRQTRITLAKRVLAAEISLHEAAKRAKCSERTISRYVADYRR